MLHAGGLLVGRSLVQLQKHGESDFVGCPPTCMRMQMSTMHDTIMSGLRQGGAAVFRSGCRELPISCFYDAFWTVCGA